MNVHVMHTAFMKLETFLSEQKLSDSDFAGKIGVSRSMVTKMRHRKARPSASTALLIEKETHGLVSLSDLLNIEAPAEIEIQENGAAA